jgi:hypothetical protein
VGVTVAADGFILQKGGYDKGKSTLTFRHSPIKFLKILMSQIRRNEEGISQTHIGKIFDGMILRLSDFQEPANGHNPTIQRLAYRVKASPDLVPPPCTRRKHKVL